MIDEIDRGIERNEFVFLERPCSPETEHEPEHGADLASELERIVTLHDASTIAAVIVEPVAGSTGVLIPPKGYLKKLREICTKHGILLIFDEVITGFGRMGSNFGADYYGVVPDMLNFAKCVTNGVIPLGGVICRDRLYDAMMKTEAPEHVIEFFHGYTYSGHPAACAAGIATLDIYQRDGLFERGREYFEEQAQRLSSAFEAGRSAMKDEITRGRSTSN